MGLLPANFKSAVSADFTIRAFANDPARCSMLTHTREYLLFKEPLGDGSCVIRTEVGFLFRGRSRRRCAERLSARQQCHSVGGQTSWPAANGPESARSSRWRHRGRARRSPFSEGGQPTASASNTEPTSYISTVRRSIFPTAAREVEYRSGQILQPQTSPPMGRSSSSARMRRRSPSAVTLPSANR
jgi:hypothetical protein